MKIDVSKKLTAFDGQVLLDKDAKGEVIEVTSKIVVVNSLLVPVKTDDGVAKVKKYELAKKVFQAEQEVELTVEEAALIKERIADSYGVLVVGQVWEQLER